MPTAPDCLLGLIGLSADGSPCFPLAGLSDAAKAAAQASATGLYLDTAEGLLRPPSQGQATAEEFYQKLTSARDLATKQVRTSLLQRGRAAFGTSRYAGKQGVLGGLGNGALMPEGTPARLTLHTAAKPSGGWRIQSVQLYTSVPVTNAPLLLDGALIGTVTTGSGFVALPNAGVLVPLDGQTHTLEAVLPAGVRVKQNTLTCGCGNEWVNYVKTCLTGAGTGWAGTPNPPDVRAFGGGMAVQVKEECTEPLDVLCYAVAADDELATSIGWAILYTAASLFIVDMITNAQRNRYTSLEPKALPDQQVYYENKAETHLAWLVGPEGLGRVQHPCYVCQAPAWQGGIQKIS